MFKRLSYVDLISWNMNKRNNSYFVTSETVKSGQGQPFQHFLKIYDLKVSEKGDEPECLGISEVN